MSIVEHCKKGLEYLVYIINNNNSIALVYWDPTWELPTNLLYNKIRLYYTWEPT